MSKLKKSIGEGWYNQLSSFFESSKFTTIKDKLIKHKNNVYPSGLDIFKAFETCNWENVKIVIIDDYALNTCNGLAYGTIENTLIEPLETTELMLNIELAYNKFLMNRFDYSMEFFATQGILLLNLELTYINNAFGSNPIIWKDFTDLVIDKLNKEKTGLIWVLWSPNVFNISDKINKDLHYIIKEEVKPQHFLKINKIINKQNGKSEEIKWY